jgi:hypothetical protein
MNHVAKQRFMNRNSVLSSLALVVLLAVPTGCLGGQDEDDPAETGIEQDLSASFALTCDNPSVSQGIDNRMRLFLFNAHATACRRRNGTKTGPVSLPGPCFTDIANCDGRLVCGSC